MALAHLSTHSHPSPALTIVLILYVPHVSRLLSAGSSERAGPGKVFLVGTGPGDPGLLTLRAVQLMQSADVVLYDRLVSDDILQLVHGGARMVYVGKQAGYHTRTQVSFCKICCATAEATALVLSN